MQSRHQGPLGLWLMVRGLWFFRDEVYLRFSRTEIPALGVWTKAKKQRVNERVSGSNCDGVMLLSVRLLHAIAWMIRLN